MVINDGRDWLKEDADLVGLGWRIAPRKRPVSSRSAALGAHGITRATTDDPLGGVVRVTRSGALDVDVIIGKCEWMSAGVERAVSLAPAGVPVVQLADLIVLKLYAGGLQDGWAGGRMGR